MPGAGIWPAVLRVSEIVESKCHMYYATICRITAHQPLAVDPLLKRISIPFAKLHQIASFPGERLRSQYTVFHIKIE